MAVGPDQDPDVRPIAVDRPHEPAQVGADFCPTRPLGRPQNRADEAAPSNTTIGWKPYSS